MRDITKVKFDGEKVEIHYGASYMPRRFTLVSLDQPTTEFVQALQNFSDAVVEILELPSDYKRGMTVRGVTISYDEEGNPKCTITAIKALENSNAPAVFNTPHGCEFRNDAVLLEALSEQAGLYLDGQRQQGMFDFGEEPEPELAAVSNG